MVDSEEAELPDYENSPRGTTRCTRSVCSSVQCAVQCSTVMPSGVHCSAVVCPQCSTDYVIQFP